MAARKPRTTPPAKAPAAENTQGASGTARKAPSAGSGAEDIDASAGTQSAPPPIISEAQPTADAEGRKAEPESIEGAPAQAGSDASESPSPETGEVEGAAAAAAPEAVQPVAVHFALPPTTMQPATLMALDWPAGLALRKAVPGVRIICRRPGFRRAGMPHPAGPITYPLSRFTDQQIDMMIAEPLLQIEFVEDIDTE